MRDRGRLLSMFWQLRVLMLLVILSYAQAAPSAEAMCGEDTSDSEYKVICPNKTTWFGDPGSKTLSFSEHFVIRASYDDLELLDTHLKDGSYLSQQAQAGILSRSEEIWTKFIDEIKFDPPYKYSTKKYKTNIFVSDYGYLSGGAFNENIPGAPHPFLQAQFGATGGYGGLAHEFTHTLQNMAIGSSWFEFGGWFSESHAEFMRSQMTGLPGCSDMLLYTPQFHYGSTKNRYCNWQFWEYLAETEGFDAINKIWTSSINGPEFKLNGSNQKIPSRCETLDGVFSTLMRIMDWTIEDLNDVFGKWAMANVGWDYERMGKAFKKEYGNTPERSMEIGEWGRLTRLNLIEIGDSEPYYAPPDYIAPERWGYNLVQLFPETGASNITITFRGVIQNQSARGKSFGNFNKEPDRDFSPDSGWRFGLVAIQADGKTRHSALMSGAKATLNFKTLPDDKQTYLVVLGAPTILHQIRWDQPAYSIYRYPWRVQIDGAIPDGSQDRSAEIANIVGSFHTNGGGFVADTATVSETAYVGPQALVLDKAMVFDSAKIEGRSTIFGNAKVSEFATVRGQARVGREARVYGHAVIHDAAQIWGGVVHGNAKIGALTLLRGNTEVYDNAVVASTNGPVPINGRGRIYGTAQVLGAVEFNSIKVLSSGVWYGLVHDEFKGDPKWGADRTAAEDEVTMSLENVGWEDYTKFSGHRSEHHQEVLAICIDPSSSSAPSFSPSDSPTPPTSPTTSAPTACAPGYHTYDDSTGNCTAYGGTCGNGDIIVQSSRTRENHCGQCDDGFYLSNSGISNNKYCFACKHIMNSIVGVLDDSCNKCDGPLAANCAAADCDKDYHTFVDAVGCSAKFPAPDFWPALSELQTSKMCSIYEDVNVGCNMCSSYENVKVGCDESIADCLALGQERCDSTANCYGVSIFLGHAWLPGHVKLCKYRTLQNEKGWVTLMKACFDFSAIASVTTGSCSACANGVLQTDCTIATCEDSSYTYDATSGTCFATKSPTNSPTDSPTNSPTDSPTSPTNSGTDSPTNSPTDSPTNSPTDSPTSPTNSGTDSSTNSPTDSPTSPTNSGTDSCRADTFEIATDCLKISVFTTVGCAADPLIEYVDKDTKISLGSIEFKFKCIATDKVKATYKETTGKAFVEIGEYPLDETCLRLQGKFEGTDFNFSVKFEGKCSDNNDASSTPSPAVKVTAGLASSFLVFAMLQ